jgi:hypothetical protein
MSKFRTLMFTIFNSLVEFLYFDSVFGQSGGFVRYTSTNSQDAIINNYSLYSVDLLLLQSWIQNARQVSEFSSALTVLSRHILSVDRYKMGEMLLRRVGN